MNPNIFREYDIRGRAPDELNQETIYRLGLSIGTYYHDLGTQKIALGRDCRLSSPGLREAILKGLIEAGMYVVNVGMIPTPLLYFSLFSPTPAPLSALSPLPFATHLRHLCDKLVVE